MFAVLKTGGKQYKVQSGDVLKVEKLAADAGEKVQFNEVLMLGGDKPVLGAPLVDGAAVQAEVVDQIKGDKLIHFVKRRRKHGSQRTKGHRQKLTLIKITEILPSGAETSGIKAATGASSVLGAATAAPAKRPATANAGKAQSTAIEQGEKKAVNPTQAEATPAAVDDLKKLTGVGPALEKKLNSSGITSYAQIAAWTNEDVAAINEQLSFNGKIEREGWINQARELAK